MATVYLAQDLRHDRKVALKVLRPELAAVIGAERFLHEIRTTANLQHPHILPLFDSGDADSFLFYVMPYVEGESVRDKLRREKQFSLDDALNVTRAVASALDYAHRHGVIHRDIKPENVLLHDGQALVLDFGIALAASHAGATRLTETGLSVGTPQYMSPEQAMGDRELDARSDIYSLGAMLYEMLAGDPPYTGSTAQAIVAKVITEKPVPVNMHRDTVPVHVAASVQKALAKLPADRFANAADFAAALARPGLAPLMPVEDARPPRERASRVRALVPWAVAAVAFAIAAMALLTRPRTTLPPAPVVRATVQLPDEAALSRPLVELSRDARLLLVTAMRGDANHVYARQLAGNEFVSLATPAGPGGPFFSPDGRWVAFYSGPELRKRAIDGGASLTIDAGGGTVAWGGGAWFPDGTIVYQRSYTGGLWRTTAEGGVPVMLTAPDTAARELSHLWPQALPDGEHVLFTVFRTPVDSARIEVLSLSTGTRRVLATGGVFGRYVRTGHLLYARDETIYAVPFDARALRVTGAAVPVLEDVYMDRMNGVAALSVSDEGTLAYVPSSSVNRPSYLVWVDRAGRERRALDAPARYDHPALSPDGQRVAVTITEDRQSSDVWVLGLDRATRTRLTSGRDAEFGPTWTPDGAYVIYTLEEPVFQLYRRAADATSPAEPFLITPFDKDAAIVSADGRTLFFEHGVDRDAIWASPVDRSAPPARLVQGSWNSGSPAPSPDGRWLAFSESESGQEEVYVVSYPDVSARREQISSGGGTEPRWSRGGREIVFRRGERMMVVPFDPVSGRAGGEVTLFSGPYHSAAPLMRSYDVTPDGSRFLMIRGATDEPSRSVVIVTNWFAELTERMRQ